MLIKHCVLQSLRHQVKTVCTSTSKTFSVVKETSSSKHMYGIWIQSLPCQITVLNLPAKVMKSAVCND